MFDGIISVANGKVVTDTDGYDHLRQRATLSNIIHL